MAENVELVLELDDQFSSQFQKATSALDEFAERSQKAFGSDVSAEVEAQAEGIEKVSDSMGRLSEAAGPVGISLDEIAQATTSLGVSQEALDDIARRLADGLGEVNVSSEQLEDAMQRGAQAFLETQIAAGNAEPPIQDVVAASYEAGEALLEASGASEDAVAAFNELGRVMEQAAASGDNLAGIQMAFGNALERTTPTIDDHNNQLAQTENAVQGLVAKYEVLRSTLGKVGTAFLAATGLTAAAREFAREQEAMLTAEQLFPQQEVEEVERRVQMMSVATGKSIEEVSRSLRQIKASFGDAVDSVDVYGKAAELSTVHLGSMSEAIRYLDATTTIAGDSTAKATQLFSEQSVLAKESGISLGELAAFFGRLNTSIQGIRPNIGELNALLAGTRSQFDSTSQQTQVLVRVFNNLQRQGKIQQQLWRDLGVENFKMLVQQKGTIGALEAVREAAARQHVDLNKLAGGYGRFNGSVLFSVATLKGAKEAFDKVGASAVRYAEIYEKNNSRLAAATDKLKASFSVFGTLVGEAVSKGVLLFARAIEALTNAFLHLPNRVQQLIGHLIVLISTIVGVQGALTVLAPLLRKLNFPVASALAASFGAQLSKLPTLLFSVAGASKIAATGLALLTSAWVVIPGVLVAVIAMLFAARDSHIKWGEETVRLGDIFTAVWGAIVDTVHWVGEQFTKFGVFLSSLFGISWTVIWNGAKTIVANAAAFMVKAIIGFLSVVQSMPAGFKAAFAALREGLRTQVEGMGQVFLGLGDKLQGALTFNDQMKAEGTRKITEGLTKMGTDAFANAGDAWMKEAEGQYDRNLKAFTDRIHAAAEAAKKVAAPVKPPPGAEDSPGTPAPVDDKALQKMKDFEENLRNEIALLKKQTEVIDLNRFAADELLDVFERTQDLNKLGLDEGSKKYKELKALIDDAAAAQRKYNELAADKAIVNNTDDIIDGYQRELDTLHMTNKERERTIAIMELQAEAQRKIRDAEGTPDVINAQTDRQIANLIRLQDARDKDRTFTDGWKQAQEDAWESSATSAVLGAQAYDLAVGSMSSALHDMVMKGKVDWKQWALGILDAITAVITKLLVLYAVQLLTGAISGVSGGATAGLQAAGTVGTTSTYGPFAEGGVVKPRSGGTRATIGEAGEPEAVVPLSKMEEFGFDKAFKTAAKQFSKDMSNVAIDFSKEIKKSEGGGGRRGRSGDININLGGIRVEGGGGGGGRNRGQGTGPLTDDDEKTAKKIGAIVEFKIKQVLKDERRAGGINGRLG